MIEVIRQGLKADGFEVPITKLCQWFGVVRRSVYYKPSRATPKVEPAFAEQILSRYGEASTADAVLEQALIARNGSLGKVENPFLLQSDNGLVFTSRDYTLLVGSYGLKQFITPHCPQQNGMVERVIRTLKEQCVHWHRFESSQHATRTIGDWIHFYNTRRPHQALGIKTPVDAFRLAP